MNLRNIGALFVSVAGAFILGEIGLHLFFRIIQNYDIEMWRYASRLKAEVPDGRSHVHIPNSSAILMGVPVEINSKGLRDREFSYKKPEHTYRILVVGDSFTLGWGVPFEHTFPKVLEEKLARLNAEQKKYDTIEVINAGIGNYNTAQEVAFLKEEGFRYEPDEILLAYYLNDAEPVQKEVSSIFTRNSITYALVMSVKNKVIASVDHDQRYDLFYRKMYTGVSWERQKEIFSGLVQETRSRNIPLTVVVWPDFHDLKQYQFSEIHRMVTGFFKDRHVAVADALDIFTGKDSTGYWVAKDDPHPNIQANKEMANFIFRNISSRKFYEQ